MDGAFIGSIYISINKAYTSTALQTETKELNPLTQSGQELFGLSGLQADSGRREAPAYLWLPKRVLRVFSSMSRLSWRRCSAKSSRPRWTAGRASTDSYQRLRSG